MRRGDTLAHRVELRFDPAILSLDPFPVAVRELHERWPDRATDEAGQVHAVFEDRGGVRDIDGVPLAGLLAHVLENRKPDHRKPIRRTTPRLLHLSARAISRSEQE